MARLCERCGVVPLPVQQGPGRPRKYCAGCSKPNGYSSRDKDYDPLHPHCADCNTALDVQVGRGRPLKYCDVCRGIRYRKGNKKRYWNGDESAIPRTTLRSRF